MPSLKEVRTRISSVMSTQQITKAMKMVAAAKLRRAQDRIIQIRPYVDKLNEILNNVSQVVDELANDYSGQRPVDRVLLVVVASDKGLCGAFNSNVFKRTISLIKDKYEDVKKGGNLHILPIGKRSYEYFKKRDYTIIDGYWELFSDLSFENVKKAAEFVMESYKEEEYDAVSLIYNEFKNVTAQILRVDPFLPLQDDEPTTTHAPVHVDYIFEPNKEYITNTLIPQALKIEFLKALLESNASEQGARMTAMDQATENAGEMLKQLRLDFNRTRQASITKEILEIVGGAEALAD